MRKLGSRECLELLPYQLVCGRAQVEMYPSKSDGMFVPESLIFRSDSNGEDLEGYAGAGLYDSITMDTTELRKVDYASDK
jgi:alpha-glucan,water dikinase